jgi:multidrug efflux pump subunit AcrB
MPDEDQGVFMGEVGLPDAASLSRTSNIINKVDTNLQSQKWTRSVFTVSGQSILESMNLANKGFFIVLLKPYEERKSSDLSVFSAVALVGNAFSKFNDAQIMPFNLPAIPSGAVQSGLSLELQSISGVNEEEFVAVARGFVNATSGDKRLSYVSLGSGMTTREILVEVDRDKTSALGIDVTDIYSTLQANLNGKYVNDFNYLGRTWEVIIQGESDVRTKIDDIYKLEVKSKNGDMVSLGNLITTKVILAPISLTRYNNLSSISINVAKSVNSTSGDAIAAIEEIAAKKLPKNYKIEWTGSALQEKNSASQTTFVLILALFFAYLCLVSLYESWLVPISVLIGLVTGLFGAFVALFLLGVANDIYAKIGIVVLIALAAKNAILIVEVAEENIERGEALITAAINAANQRFRAIIMTSFAFILGILPLVIASGPGANTQRSVSTAVFGGMLAATLIGVLLIPPLFIIVKQLPEKFLNFHDNVFKFIKSRF